MVCSAACGGDASSGAENAESGPVEQPDASGSSDAEPGPAPNPLAARTLVVYNSDDTDSVGVADYYVAKRSIPDANRCPISLSKIPNANLIGVAYANLADYEAPIKTCLNSVGPDNILYIVFTYDTPFSVQFTPAPAGSHGSSLDNYIANIWGEQTFPALNRYYVDDRADTNAYQPFVSLADYRSASGAPIIYSVFRLDAATPEMAKGLVDLALQAERDGVDGIGCFDRDFGKPMDQIQYTGYGLGEWWLHRAAEVTSAAGFPTIEDPNVAEIGTAPAPARCDDVLFYSGWYSYGNYNDVFTYVPGAVNGHIDSLSAGGPRSGRSWSPSSVARGVTVTTGAVNEPELTGIARADDWVRYMVLDHANAGDAIFRATSEVGWMIMNIGDPLYTPFPKATAEPAAPTKLVLSGAVVVPATLCSPYRIIAKDDRNSESIGVAKDVKIALSTSADASVYADPSCMSRIMSATIPAGAASATVYLRDSTPEPFTLSAQDGAGTLRASTFSARAISPATMTLEAAAFTHGGCTAANLQLFDNYGFHAATMRDVNVTFAIAGSAKLYTDAACTQPAGLAGRIAAGSDRTRYFVSDAVAESFTITTTDASHEFDAAILNDQAK